MDAYYSVIIFLEVCCLSELQFFIRHQENFLQNKFILVFKSDQARDFFQKTIPGSHFEQVTSDVAEHVARMGVDGKTVPYGYTLKLTEDEMNQLSTAPVDWVKTAELLAEGNERLYQEAKTKQSGGEGE